LLNSAPASLRILGNTVVDAWNVAIIDVPKMSLVYANEIAGNIRNIDKAKGHADYLYERYGL